MVEGVTADFRGKVVGYRNLDKIVWRCGELISPIRVENCVFHDNNIALRLRGPGSRGGAHVTVRDCYFYNCAVAFRIEDGIEQLRIIRPHFGAGVQRRYHEVSRKAVGLKVEAEQGAPPIKQLLDAGSP